MREVLLNPGPVTLSERVRRALTRPDLCHREPEFGELQEGVRAGLLGAYGLPAEEWAAVLLAGSGTAAMEAMLASLVPEAGTLLVVANGVYGERLSSIAAIHGIARRELRTEWGAPIDADALERVLDDDPSIAQVAVVHHETTTGRLNDIAPVGRLCRARGLDFLVDGVSSFGGEELDFEGWGIDACAATANKCLHGVPGVSFVVARRGLLEQDGRPERTLYLDLQRLLREQDRRGTPFTQPVHVLHALAEALAEFEEQGGWSARRERYRRFARRVREGMQELGIEPLLTPGDTSAVLAAYRLPAGMEYATLHDGLKRRGFVIYAGQGGLQSEIFRIATMGDLRDEDFERLLGATREVLEENRAASGPR